MLVLQGVVCEAALSLDSVNTCYDNHTYAFPSTAKFYNELRTAPRTLPGNIIKIIY